MAARFQGFLMQILLSVTFIRGQDRNAKQFHIWRTRQSPCKKSQACGAIRYWFKIVQSDDLKYIKLVYNTMLEDLQRLPEKLSLLRYY